MYTHSNSHKRTKFLQTVTVFMMAFAFMFTLVSCGDQDRQGADSSQFKPLDSLQCSDSLLGEAIPYDGAVYYTKITMVDSDFYPVPMELCCSKDGKETVLFDAMRYFSESTSGCSITSDFAIANNKIFFIAYDWEGGSYFFVYDLSAKKLKKLKGIKNANNIVGLSSDGNSLVFCEYDENQWPDTLTYYVVDTTQSTPSVGKGVKTYSCEMRDGTIYYSKYNASGKTFDLYKAAPDGTETTKLGTFKAPKLVKNKEGDYENAVYSAADYVIRKIEGKEYVYYSYTLTYDNPNKQSKKWIARASLDGSESEMLIEGKSFDEYKDYFINDDGSVSPNNLNEKWSDDINYNSDENYYYVLRKNNVYSIQKSDGSSLLILKKKEYEDYCKNADTVYLSGVDLFDGKAYIRLFYDFEDSYQSEGTPPGGFLLEKDLKSGEIKLLYRYQRLAPKE